MRMMRWVAMAVSVWSVVALAAPAWAAEGTVPAPSETPSLGEAAVAAAEKWLGFVDHGDTAASWESAATHFKTAVTQEQWKQAMAAARGPLGAVRTRTLVSKEPATSLPGAPDGHYMVIQYETSFEKKQAAVETVTPMQEPDGSWKVAGYYIR